MQTELQPKHQSIEMVKIKPTLSGKELMQAKQQASIAQIIKSSPQRILKLSYFHSIFLFTIDRDNIVILSNDNGASVTAR
jgi:hypothetical protein